MALAFATRYPALSVLIGDHDRDGDRPSRLGGRSARPWPRHPGQRIAIVAGLAFFAFAAWTLRGDSSARGRGGRARRRRPARSSSPSGTAFFLAELGDKTMLATITLATHDGRSRDVARVHRRDGRGRRASPSASASSSAHDLPERAIRIGADGRVRRVRRDPASWRECAGSCSRAREVAPRRPSRDNRARMPDELSPSQAAARIGATTRTVQRWIALGQAARSTRRRTLACRV